ncbi:MAG: RQC-minor-1 family DNA-binding protein [Chloroflexota bacterium]|nr:RQC-minor-1 family DNA-binding protein [Chloroflexota bacterium]
MSRRRRRRVPVTLVLPAEPPAREEIDVILMAADAIVGRAGRSGVTLILNGSRSKKALRWEWDKLPDYGALEHLTADQITRKIDWCIHHRWLRLEHDRDGIPLLYHSTKGWERVKQLWVERLLVWFEQWRRAGQPGRVWPRLETINREIKLMLLEAIEEQARRELTPVLRAWFPHEVRAVRKRINRVVQGLGERTLRHPRRRAD